MSVNELLCQRVIKVKTIGFVFRVLKVKQSRHRCDFHMLKVDLYPDMQKESSNFNKKQADNYYYCSSVPCCNPKGRPGQVNNSQLRKQLPSN